MLSKTRNPRQDEVCPLCSSWNVPQYERIQHGQNRRRPLAILITELRQAVITEASRLRTIFHGQTAASASCAQLPATLAGASSSVESSASSADQPAAFAGAVSSTQQPDVIGCTGKRLVDSVSCAQPVRECKLPRAGASPSSASAALGAGSCRERFVFAAKLRTRDAAHKSFTRAPNNITLFSAARGQEPRRAQTQQHSERHSQAAANPRWQCMKQHASHGGPQRAPVGRGRHTAMRMPLLHSMAYPPSVSVSRLW